MKKDKRFLNSLEKELSVLSEKDRNFIVNKYRKIIDEGLSNKKKITVILREIGPVKLVALNEIEEIRAKKKDNVFKRFYSFITKDLTVKDEKELEEKNKEKEAKKEERKKLQEEKKEERAKLREEKRVNRGILLAERKQKREENREERRKQREAKKEERAKLREEKKKDREKYKNASKEEKAELRKARKEKNRFLREEKKKLRELEKEEKKKEKEAKKEAKKENKIKESVEEVFEETIPDTIEEIAETHIFESKEARRKRILLTTLGVIITVLLIFVWLWVTVLAIACGFAYLDGVKFVGLIIAAFAADFLLLWIVVMINRAVFHKKNRVVLNLVISFICVGLIALGIVLFVRKLNSIQSIEDVSEKYSMSTKYDTYMLPSDTNKKLSFIFNANYKTQYIVDYDEKMIGKVKVEVKYYEAYYDYFIKKSSNIVYISLKLDDRDRLSTYISDIKDGVIYDADELSRYVVKITIAKEDADRIEIID